MLVTEVATKSKKRGRRAGNRAGKRRSRRAVVTVTAVTALPEKFQYSSPVNCAVHAFLMRYQSALRKVPAHLPPRVHAGPPSKRVKRVSWSKLFTYIYVLWKFTVFGGTLGTLTLKERRLKLIDHYDVTFLVKGKTIRGLN